MQWSSVAFVTSGDNQVLAAHYERARSGLREWGTENNSIKPNDTSILCSIPINSASGSIISYTNNFNVSNDVYNTSNLTLLHLKLTDQDGAILDLNGCHFSLTLQLDIYKK